MIEYIPGLAGVPATESSISSIDGKNGILAYRGYSIEDLVKYASFEEVAMLLRDGELPSRCLIKIKILRFYCKVMVAL
jgi:citrate synthase